LAGTLSVLGIAATAPATAELLFIHKQLDSAQAAD